MASRKPKETSDEKHRRRIETVVKKVKPNVRITGRYRSKRGAIDIASKDMSEEDRHNEAKAISLALKESYPDAIYDVVVEEVNNGRQKNTTYRDGEKGKVREFPKAKATATHTHIEYDSPREKTKD